MGRRVLALVLLLASGIVVVAIFAVAPSYLHDRLAPGASAGAHLGGGP